MTGRGHRRSAGTVRNELSKLWKEKVLQRSDEGYVLTQVGLRAAAQIVRDHAE